MQVIIPVAGAGTRMRPHTHTKPKPLLHVAGKAVIDYILDELRDLGNVSEIIFITGHLGDKFEQHVKKYNFRMRFIEQKTLDGSSGAVKLAKQYISEDVLIIFADTIFNVDLGIIKNTEADGLIWAKKVEDYQRFGIMITDDKDNLIEMKEKPKEPYTRLANIGLYYLKDHKLMFQCIEEQYDKNMKSKGEYNFPEALGMMAQKGQKLKIVEAEGWYDTGKPETVLETQKVLLKKRHREGTTKNSKITEPVYIEEGADVENCQIGPNVSIAKGAIVRNSSLRDCVVGVRSEIENCNLSKSFIGDRARVIGTNGQVNVGDDSEVIHEDNT